MQLRSADTGMTFYVYSLKLLQKWMKYLNIKCAIINKWKQEFLVCMGGFSGWSVFKMFTRPYKQNCGICFYVQCCFDSRYKIAQLPLSVRNSKMPCASTTCSCFTATVLSNSKWCDMLSENRFSVWALNDNMLRKGLKFITLLHETAEVFIIKKKLKLTSCQIMTYKCSWCIRYIKTLHTWIAQDNEKHEKIISLQN